ncbi:hypothetical protein F53441_12693 [Fusarium austroafricanum]|uniref:Uncharacterized protein n=1 Tax=Fusarium austroafricanum TaxID=2364996 RepID=A0A8H4NUQ8_9HYPO|nr:hypothetical protein F53441_12693 [Fusarium austroafricanum]
MSPQQSYEPFSQSSAADDLADAEFRLLTIEALDESHRDAVARAIIRILDTEIAETTYAQIVDGLPLADVAADSSDGGPPRDHPIHKVHKSLCEGVLGKVKEFRDQFDALILNFDSRIITQLLLLFQAAAPGSRSFRIRLVEIVAVSIHQIARILFQISESPHKEEGIIEWAPPKSASLYWGYCPEGPLPTMFYHPWYKSYERYPHGIADMVGYWAEARIIGGVVLFDRRQQIPGFIVDPDAIYLHPNRIDVTYRICKLLPEQKQLLLEFLTSDSPPPSPLPILVDESNDYRIDPEESTEVTGIHRDIWDRSELPPYAVDQRLSDVWDKLDFPTRTDKDDAGDRALERKQALAYGEDYEKTQ